MNEGASMLLLRHLLWVPKASPGGSGRSKAVRDEVINQGQQMECAKFFERKLKDAALLKIDISMR